MHARVQVRIGFALGLALAGGGCAGQTSLPNLFPIFGKPPEVQEAEPKKAPPEQPACKGAEKCAALLRKLVADPKRTWVGQRQPPAAYSDGTRLFAYRALKPKLNCPELVRAVEETTAALPELAGDTFAATRKLMAQVNAELRSERARRCKPAAKS